MTSNNNIIQPHLNKSRKDKFILILTIPNILKSLNTPNERRDGFINLDSLQFSVISANIPSVEIPSIEMRYAGQTHNITSFSRPTYTPVQISFNIDNEYKNYWLLWKWLQLFNDVKEGTYGSPSIFERDNYPMTDPHLLNDYSTTITLNALDEYNKPKIEFIFTNSFITRLSEFQFDYKDDSEINCSFNFIFNRMNSSLI